MGFYDVLLSRTRNIEYRNDNSPFWGLLSHGRSANTSKALLSREKLPDHFQPDGLNVVKGLIFPLLRFSALIILFSGNISFSSASSQLSVFSLNCRRSLNQFLIVKSNTEKSRRNFFSRRICLLTSWTCIIGIYIISSVMHAFWLVLTHDLLEDRRIHDVIINTFFNSLLYKANRFQVAVRLFSNRSQRTSKCGKNISISYTSSANWNLLNEARSRNWIWLDKSTHCVINNNMILIKLIVRFSCLISTVKSTVYTYSTQTKRELRDFLSDTTCTVKYATKETIHTQ